MLVTALSPPPKRSDPKPTITPGQDAPSRTCLPTLLISKAALEAAATGAAAPSTAEGEVVAIPPELVAVWTDDGVQAALRDLVGDGFRQLGPVAGQLYDGAVLMLGARPLVERWLDPAKDDPVALAIDTTAWLTTAGKLAADHLPVLAPYKPYLDTIGFGCSIVGTVYKGRAELSAGEEQQVVGRLERTVVAKLASSPNALAYALANAARQGRPPGPVRPSRRP